MSVLESATEAANRIIHGDTNETDVQLVAGELLELSARLAQADDLLRRLAEWDMLRVKPVIADGSYWRAEIARCRTTLAGDSDG